MKSKIYCKKNNKVRNDYKIKWQHWLLNYLGTLSRNALSTQHVEINRWNNETKIKLILSSILVVVAALTRAVTLVTHCTAHFPTSSFCKPRYNHQHISVTQYTSVSFNSTPHQNSVPGGIHFSSSRKPPCPHNHFKDFKKWRPFANAPVKCGFTHKTRC